MMMTRYAGLVRPVWRTGLTTLACLSPAISGAEVRILGLEDPLLTNALGHVALDEEPCDSPTWRVDEQFERADDSIRAALEAFGYYDVRIESSLESGESCWAANFDVQLGEPVRLRQLNVSVLGEAETDSIFSEFVEGSVLTVGEPLLHGAYDELKRGLLEIAQRRGYAEAAFTASRIDVYPAERVADIVLTLESGPRYVFGAITLAQEVLDAELLERYLQFATGDPYHRSHLTALYAALADSGYFETVDVRPLPADTAAKQIAVAVNLTPARRRARSFGVGYSTDTGPRFRFGRTNRRVNARGAQSGVNGQLSPVISELSYNYRFPYRDPRSEWISFDTGIKHEDTETSVSDTLQLGARRFVSRAGDWQETQFVDLLIEDFRVADTKSRSRLLMPGISWLNVRADNPIRPDNGRRLMLELAGAGDALGSDTSFLQLIAEGKWIWSLANRSRILVRARAGITWEDDFDKLPPSVRFFAGGDDSVRGYKFEALGPTDADGDVIGGSRLLVASVEYEIPVTAKWSVAAFLDSGNAYNGSTVNAMSGAGVGFRWQSPLGPIRVDVAKPLDGFDRDPRLHVTLGADL